VQNLVSGKAAKIRSQRSDIWSQTDFWCIISGLWSSQRSQVSGQWSENTACWEAAG